MTRFPCWRLARALHLGSAAMLSATAASAQPAVQVTLKPDPIEAGEALSAEIFVSNDGRGGLNGIEPQARVPAQSNAVNEAPITGSTPDTRRLQATSSGNP